EFGEVVITNRSVDEEDVILPLQKVIRLATEQDILTMTENSEVAYKAFNIGVKKIEHHKLDMTLVDAGYTFDRNKVIFDLDRKSTRLNSSHVSISYAVFCLKKKNHIKIQ